MTLWDYGAAQAAKQRGMDAAADKAGDRLAKAREIAADIARQTDGTCNADQVGEHLERQGIEPGPWCGSIFRGWHFTGRRVRSSRVSNHGREIKVWALEEGHHGG